MRSSDVPANLLNASRFALAAMIAFGAFGNLVTWQREGWNTPVSPFAQVAEAIACVVVLWWPLAGLLIALIPMGLTIGFGTMEADLLVTLIVPATFVAVARPLKAAGVTGLFLVYGVVRSLQSGPSWDVGAAYLAFLIPGVLGGLALRALFVAWKRRQGRVQVMGEDVRRIRGEERGRLAFELRSLITVRLADTAAVLDSARTITEPGMMRAAIGRVNEACLGALREVRALVGMLREDPTADGHDESVAVPLVTTTLAGLGERLERGGSRARFEGVAELDSLNTVTQATVVKVMEEIVEDVLTQGTGGSEVTMTVEQRRGWVGVEVRYPDTSGSQGGFARLRRRAEALGGRLDVADGDGVRQVRLDLPPDQSLPHAGGRRAAWAWRRFASGGAVRGIATVALTLGGLAAGAGLLDAAAAGVVHWGTVWEVAGFAAAALLLWWPTVGAAPATIAGLGMMYSSHSDDLALAALLLVACWQAARVTRRWAAVTLGIIAGLALLVATVADVGAARERTIVAAVVLIALPAFIAGRHFLVTKRRQLEEMAGLERASERIRTEERNLLARELHDVVAHHLSVATLQSMAYGESEDPAELRTALDRMERSTRGAEGEMELLGRIMSENAGIVSDAAMVRPTTIAGVLAETLRDNGFRVSVSVDPLSDELPSPTLRTLTRVMQEGVTNILRYGRREGQCQLSLSVGTAEVSLRMSNSLPSRRRTSALSLGYGLTGIRERVDLLGGRFQVAAEDGAWVMHVDLPLGR